MMSWVIVASALASDRGPAKACARDLGGLAEGPSSVGIRPGELGRAHRVCARSEMAFAGAASLLADAPNFYGHLVGVGELEGSWSPTGRTEVFGRIEAVRYDSVLAPLPDAYFGPGWFSVGAAQRLSEDPKGALGVNGKLAVPAHYTNATPIGGDVGLAGLWAPSPRLRAHGQLSAVFQANFGPGPTRPSMGIAPTVGAEWLPGSAFAFALDVVSSVGLTSALDHVAVAPSFRFSTGDRFGMELALAAPLAGADRTLALADLRLAVRL